MNPHIEPSAAQREGARGAFGLFVALTGEGFTEAQALAIIGTMLGTFMANDTGDKDPS